MSSTPSSQAKTTKAGKNNNLRSIILFVLFAGLGYIGYTYFTTAAGPRTFTPRQLSAYDGSNPDLPLYISIGGEVYDVSANRRVYGKGGAYNIM